jgi:hypothetical protein
MRRTTWHVLTTAALLSSSLLVAAADTPAPQTEGPAQATSPANVPDLSGEWCGSWFSCVNGHNGPMNARFCRRCDGHYDVAFHGRFWKLVPFRYTATLAVTGHADGKVYLSGSHYLGPLLGTFSYNAWSDGCQFVAGYCSRNDNGQFVMSR